MALSRNSSFRSRRRDPVSRCGKCCHYCRQVVTFFVSHIGLCTLLLGYAILGAFVFQWIESEHEQRMPLEVAQLREDIISRLSTITKNMSVLIKSHWSSEASNVMDHFEQRLMHAVKYKGYNGNDKLTPTNSQWSFSGALLYSIIVFTSIGYGNVAPRTDLGKVITILYALVGIPLTLFCLSNIGHALARMFKFVYFRCCCFLCAKPKSFQHREKRRRMLLRRQRHRAMLEYTLANAKVDGLWNDVLLRENKALANGLTRPNSLLSPPSPLKCFPNNRSSSPAHDPNLDATSESSTSCQEPKESLKIEANQKKPKRKTNMVTRKVSQIFSTKSTVEKAKSESGTEDDRLWESSKRGALSRSLSARFHNENKPVDGVQYYRQHKTSHPPSIIANKFASLSDECIDVHVGQEIEPPTAPITPVTPILNSNTKVRRQPSQVRFRAPGDVELGLSEPGPSPKSGSPRTVEANDSKFVFPVSNNSAAHLTPPPPPICLAPSPLTASAVLLPMYDNASRPMKTDPVLIDRIQTDGGTVKNADLIEFILAANESMLDSDDEDGDGNVTEKNIPITVCLSLVFGYICGGAFFFSASEDWSFLDSFYFCFITLSTIGFGDLVPGRTVLTEAPEESHMTLAICALYLLFGMALLAMSLNLVKEKVIEMVRTVGLRIGILVAEDDDDESDDERNV